MLQLVALGWKTGRIADELGLSPHTVLNHVPNFRRRLNSPSKLIAVARHATWHCPRPVMAWTWRTDVRWTEV